MIREMTMMVFRKKSCTYTIISPTFSGEFKYQKRYPKWIPTSVSLIIEPFKAPNLFLGSMMNFVHHGFIMPKKTGFVKKKQ